MNNNLQHSEKFIQSKVGNNSGFLIPKNYFDGIEDIVITTLSLENFPKEINFEVPTDYFANLENEILAKVSSKEKEVKVISLRKRILQFIPITTAASVLLFIGINYFSNYTTTFDDITTADLDTWYENNDEDLNISELAMVFAATDFEETMLSETSIDDSDLEDYLNKIDDSSLLN